MRSTKRLRITLPNEMARKLAAKVASGEYATESEVIREGLRALKARERTFERWLRGDVSRAYDQTTTDPSDVRSPLDVKASLARAHRRHARRK